VAADQLKLPEPGMMQRLVLSDGSQLVGKITEVRDNEVVFHTDSGDMTVQKSKVKSIEEFSQSALRDGEYWYPNPNQTRLFIGPTARTLEKGRGYLFDMLIFFPGAAYGITDQFMVSGGMTIFPDSDDQLFYFMPKYGFPVSDRLDLAASLVVLHVDNTGFLTMGSATYGTDDYSVTGGLALAWDDGELQDDPAMTFGGEYRLSRRVSLVGEGWFIPGGDGGALLIPGVRLFGEQMAFDFGILYSAGNEEESDGFELEEPSWFPYIDFVWNF
jgi:hypothetical protein